jgi:6,7-dimethyl-8-ribityllumazine synthase
MLKRIKSTKAIWTGGHYAIVASRYNGRYVDGMLRAARARLAAAQVGSVEVYRVPGSFEVPTVVAHLARRHHPRPSAIICLGVILRGETKHADHIGEAVSHALARIQVETEVPVVHAVLLLENEEQARVRCLSREHNRGLEAANTALEMAAVMADLAGRG